MIRRALQILALVSLVALVSAPTAPAAAAPAWKLRLASSPTVFPLSSSGEPTYEILATNVGAAAATGTIAIADTLPEGLTVVHVGGGTFGNAAIPNPTCEVAGRAVTCTTTGTLNPGFTIGVNIRVEADPSPPASVFDEASVEGGGASRATATTTTAIGPSESPFDFLPGGKGLNAPLTGEDGAAATAAGSHPYQLTVDLGFPTVEPGPFLTGAEGGVRDSSADLPRGTIIDPAATPVLCTEAQLTSQFDPGCPRASQIGILTVPTSTAGGAGSVVPQHSMLFNMVPPPGAPAAFGADIGGLGIFVHVIGSLRSDGDYGISGGSNDILSLGAHPVLSVYLELWGDPSSSVHDSIRGQCSFSAADDTCPIEASEKTGIALLTLPSDCPGHPITTRARADSWGAPGVFHETSYESADLAGNPVSVDGCNSLEFKPTISSKPTTNLIDSPSGLDFNLHQPQEMKLGAHSNAPLKDASVTLPAGMVVNPSQANGLGACSEDQIGYSGGRFSKQPDSCPESSKLGTVQVGSPLLAQLSEDGTKVQYDAEGKAIPRPLQGSVYIAKPFENPFGSLIAIYLSVSDPRSGIVAKLAGKAIPDPVTGQLTTRFEENPELPLEDVTLHLFDGARAPLITPPTCATQTTTSDLTPWSAPDGLDAHPSDSFQLSASPGGGSCPSAENQAASKPAFTAGTIAPKAGAYSPFVLKLSREDGSQRLGGIEATLPKGLAAKFAGVAQCSDAQIAAAQARSHPNEGILEKQSPSCPASSKLGSVDVAAGAGPTPFHAQGTAYLAGPYKGAPLSLAIITPAIAGPFDLGAVTVRTALYVDPNTAQGKAVSDPLPQIIDGIPLDVRSIYLEMDRPEFTLNPTSCDPMAVTGSATSSLGASAALSSPFQVGGCSQLPFKPKLSIRLKGGTKRASHPKLIASLKAKPGEANIAKAQVKLPPSAFLDQAHIRTVCTRVQFAANACPKGSIYGTATAVTPLLDQPLTGNVYLRSSSHKLPDLVVALKGPASLPIEIDLDGKTDSVKGALRNTFEAVPDAPVTSFRLELFGGKRGLVINSRDLCRHPYKAEVNLDGQNGKVFDTEPAVGADCAKKGRKGKRRSHGR